MPNHRAPLRVRVVTVLVAVTLGLSGCGHPFSGEVIPAAQVGTRASTPTVDGDPGDARLTVAGDADPHGWRPDQPIVVNAIAGTLGEVSVTSAGGQDVAGALSEDRRHWQTSGALLPGTTYAVRATMTGSPDTDPVTRTLSLSTRESAAPFRARISPRDGATVGVGMPILVTFTAPVEQDRRAEVQDALTVTASAEVEGAWNWVSDTKIQYRTKEYWPARTEVSVTADLAGVQAAADVWGDQDKQVDFQIGESVVSVVDVTSPPDDGDDRRPGRAHHPGDHRQGRVPHPRRHPRDLREARGDPDGCREHRDQTGRSGVLQPRRALRIAHDELRGVHPRRPWSVASQGVANVSHGCVGMSTANARWLFQQSRVGDVVTIVNSTRNLEPGNGLTQWNDSWEDWQAGSAS